MGYDPVITFQGVIRAIDWEGGSIVLALDDGFPPLNDQRLACARTYKIMFYDNQTLSMPRNMSNCFMETARHLGGNLWNITARHGKIPHPAGVGIGSPIVVSPRCGAAAVTFMNSASCGIEDVTMHSYPGIAVGDRGGYGANRMTRVNVVRNSSAVPFRYQVGNMGGLNANGHLYGPQLTGCHFEHIGDDFFNSHNSIALVVDVLNSTSVVVAAYDQGATMELINLQPLTTRIDQPRQNISLAPVPVFSGDAIAAEVTSNTTYQALARGASHKLFEQYHIQIIPEEHPQHTL